MARKKLIVLLVLVGAAIFGSALAYVAAKRPDPQWEFLGNAPFEPRDTVPTVEFQDFIWLSNGWTHGGTPQYRDLWRTPDGVHWQEVNGDTPYDAYSGFAVWQGSLIAASSTTWGSPDGVVWSKLANGPMASAGLPTLLNFKDRLWFFDTGKRWVSDDGGVNWEALPTAEYGYRNSYKVIATTDAMYLFGGAFMETADPPEATYSDRRSLADVWKSIDGLRWELVTDAPGWAQRMWPGVTYLDGKFYLFGGYSNVEARNLDDFWVSSDAKSWERIEPQEGEVIPSARHWPAMFTIGDALFIVAGNGPAVQNDIWRYRPRKFFGLW